MTKLEFRLGRRMTCVRHGVCIGRGCNGQDGLRHQYDKYPISITHQRQEDLGFWRCVEDKGCCQGSEDDDRR